eukprot:TRINITY_DN2682_c1_g1_i1.p1 TRINITY_DN2682_c1_g1~~TRINITY_DN2682_c1_g1_i1.p1  ORF type:complete len:394 (-),score=115.51 TRINITY_DN2682_c1_g1_i1:131-1276(-)
MADRSTGFDDFMCEDEADHLMKSLLVELCIEEGIEQVEESALDALGTRTALWIEEIGERAMTLAQLAGRSEVNSADIDAALEGEFEDGGGLSSSDEEEGPVDVPVEVNFQAPASFNPQEGGRRFQCGNIPAFFPVPPGLRTGGSSSSTTLAAPASPTAQPVTTSAETSTAVTGRKATTTGKKITAQALSAAAAAAAAEAEAEAEAEPSSLPELEEGSSVKASNAASASAPAAGPFITPVSCSPTAESKKRSLDAGAVPFEPQASTQAEATHALLLTTEAAQRAMLEVEQLRLQLGHRDQMIEQLQQEQQYASGMQLASYQSQEHYITSVPVHANVDDGSMLSGDAHAPYLQCMLPEPLPALQQPQQAQQNQCFWVAMPAPR